MLRLRDDAAMTPSADEPLRDERRDKQRGEKMLIRCDREPRAAPPFVYIRAADMPLYASVYLRRF